MFDEQRVLMGRRTTIHGVNGAKEYLRGHGLDPSQWAFRGPDYMQIWREKWRLYWGIGRGTREVRAEVEIVSMRELLNSYGILTLEQQDRLREVYRV